MVRFVEQQDREQPYSERCFPCCTDRIRNESVAVKSIGKIDIVHVQDIIWIKGASNYVELHCKDKIYLHREKIGSLEILLVNKGFIRVHRSAIVNLRKVKSITSELGRYANVLMSNGDQVGIGSSYKKTFLSIYGIQIDD